MFYKAADIRESGKRRIRVCLADELCECLIDKNMISDI